MKETESLEDIANSYNSKYGKTNKDLLEELLKDPSKVDEYLMDAEFNRYIINKKAEMHKMYKLNKVSDSNNVSTSLSVVNSKKSTYKGNLKDINLADVVSQVNEDIKNGNSIEAENYIPDELIEISERLLAYTLNKTTIGMLEQLQLEDDPKIAVALLQIYLNKLN